MEKCMHVNCQSHLSLYIYYLYKVKKIGRAEIASIFLLSHNTDLVGWAAEGVLVFEATYYLAALVGCV